MVGEPWAGPHGPHAKSGGAWGLAPRGGAKPRWVGLGAGPGWGGVRSGAGLPCAGAELNHSVLQPPPEPCSLPSPGRSVPERGGGRRDLAMASRGLPGSAVLTAAVFVGGAVSLPLVAPGEFPVSSGARRRRLGIETAAPLRPPQL